MVDRNGKEVKDIVLYMNTNIETYYCHVSEQVRSYTVEPPLPSRFTLDNNGVLTSYPSSLLEKTEFMLVATLVKGKISLNITITVINCPYDDIYVFNVINDANVTYASDDHLSRFS